ncbi:MAG TPA: MFS transporter, partial [Dehalococcoidia bacterium]|nr:MFS transporter [Dehalococcoidia bacterium]
LALAWANALWMVIYFAIAHGLGWGVRGPLQQTLRADYFGRRSFGVIMGFSNLIVMLGSILGPLIAGVMADQFGNYQAGFTLLALLSGAAAVFWFFARRPAAPRRTLPEVSH